MNFRHEWPYVVGGALTLGMLGLLITRRDPLGVGLGVAPPGAVGPRPADEPGAPLRWIELDGTPLRLFTDDRYRACVRVPFGLGWAVSVSKIVKGATEMGFRDVRAIEARPTDWPSKAGCDYFVEGVWNGADRLVDRHSAITSAWRLSRA